jgi:hypothetical protein
VVWEAMWRTPLLRFSVPRRRAVEARVTEVEVERR